MLNRIFSLFFTLALILTSGCSLFNEDVPPVLPFQSPDTKTSSDTHENTLPADQGRQYIEVVWQIPAEKVDGYVIRYGTEADRLQNEVEVRSEDVQRVHHEKYGDVFRYLIPNQPSDKTVYVSVAAVSKGHESAPSKVFEVAPEAPTPAPPAPAAALAPAGAAAAAPTK